MESTMSISAIRIVAQPAIALILITMALQIQAQTASTAPTNVVSYATSTPTFGAGHDYIQMLGETVDPGSGQLSLRINIPTPKGRGLDFPFSLNYDSAGVWQLQEANVAPLNNIFGEVDMYPVGWPNFGSGTTGFGGWSESYPQISWQNTSYTDPNSGLSCNYVANLSFTDDTGNRRWLGFVFTIGPGDNGVSPPNCIVNNGPQTAWTEDGKYQAAFTSSGGTVASQDGTVYNFGLYGGGYSSVPPYSIEDRNGNILTFTNNLGGIAVTDTLGRTVMSSSITPGNNNNGVFWISNYSVSGIPQPFTASWAYFQTPGTRTFPSTLVSQGGTGPGVCLMDAGRAAPYQPSGGTMPGLGSFALPDGTGYQFGYDSTYGLLNKITYPNGAYISYTWNNPSLNDDAYYSWMSTSVVPPFGDVYISGLGSCLFQYGRPQVSHRSVSYDGVNVALEQDFTYATTFANTSSNIGTPGWTQKTTEVVTHDYLRGTSYTTLYSYVPGGSIPVIPFMPLCTNCAGSQQQMAQMSDWPAVEHTVQYLDGSGNVLQTVNKAWFDPSRMTMQQTVLGQANGSAPTAESDYSWTGTGLMFEQDDYDYGTGSKGSLLKKTITNYPYTPSNPSNMLGNGGITPLYPYGSTLNAFPSSVVVLNGSGVVAETDYLYDQGGVSSASAVQHDNANYGAGSTAPRANATTITKKCLQAQGCSNAVTTYTYDQAGQLTSMTDPCGNGTCSDMTGATHTTYYSYADAFVPGAVLPNGATDAYVTSITQPAVSAGNFTTIFQYGYSDGKVRSVTDANQQTTQFCYYVGGCSGSTPDPWMRLTQVSYPDGGKTTASYVDTGSNPSTTISKLINNTVTEINTTIFDAMGRPIQTQLNSDPDGADFVDTTYDGESRVWTVSNPHRSSSASTDGTITLVYDPLGRKKLQTNPDTSSESWFYSGNATTFTNQVSNSWISLSDALGRLTQVTEPGGLNTFYSYDALGDLLSVNQRGNGSTDTPRTARSFNYDSLSRLLCASNPENSSGSCPSTATGGYVTGTTGYTYDPNGNVISKTDARGIITSYIYDGLNRLLSKAYSDGATPASCYQYDSSSNGIGRLANAWTLSASPEVSCPTASPFLTKRSILAYDAMGRVKSERQYTPASQRSGTFYAPAYTYDLAGNLITSTSGVAPSSAPSGAQLAYAYSGAAPIQLSYTYDGAGRLQTAGSNVSSNWINGIALPTSLFAPPPTPNTACTSQAGQYAPFGGLMNASFGIGSSSTPAFTLNRNYDNRLRITCENDQRSGTTPATPGSATVTITGAERTQ
jgi:YD repeat-containing protein